MELRCPVCFKSGTVKCKNCSQLYCCAKHKKMHWRIHREECRPFRMMEDNCNGRYMVSTRCLPAGTFLLQESPLVLGPKASSFPICLTCNVLIPKTDFYKCQECFWPMCSEQCSKSITHVKECNILKRDTKKCGVPQQITETPRYDLILILRCLLTKEYNPVFWRKIESMESHLRGRKKDAEPHHVAAVRYLTEVCPIGVDVDTVHHVRGVIVTNSIKTVNSQGTQLRGLYPTVSYFNHSCYPNVTLRSDADHNLFLRTSVDVEKGEPLLFSYVPSEDPVHSRQINLSDIYYFSCKCLRCEDATEMGTYYSSIKCFQCHKGYLCFQNPIFWSCSECGHQEPSKEMENYFSNLVKEVEDRKEIKDVHSFMKHVEDKCHSESFIYLKCLQKCLKSLNNRVKSPEENLARKGILKQLISITSKIEPGLTRKRGIYLHEYGSTVLDILNQGKEDLNQTPDDVTRKQLIKDAFEAAKNSLKILDLEPPNSTVKEWLESAKTLFTNSKSLTRKNSI